MSLQFARNRVDTARVAPVALLDDERFSSSLGSAAAGDERAFERLIEPLLSRLDGYLRAQARDEAEDLRSEVLFAIHRSLGRFVGDEAQFRSWVFTIAHHRIVDHQRRHRDQRSIDTVAEGRWSIAPGRGTEGAALDRVREDELRAILEALPAAQRQVLLLRTVGDLSLKQTAEVVGRSVGAVKLLQHRAVVTLRDRLGAENLQRDVTR